MKKIGIVSRFGEYFDKTALYMFDSYRIICLENNCLPFMILPPQMKDYYKLSGKEVGHLNESDKKYLQDFVDRCDGIIIPGGDRWYDYDKYIFEYAYEKNKPILGICMGMQVMASCDNNLLPIKNKDNSHYQKNTDYAHHIKINKDSKLYDILSLDEIGVNSYHNYHIHNVNQFSVSAVSSDGVIEAIEDKSKKFVMGLQWHPEIMYSYDENNKKIIKAFIDAL